MRIDRNQAIFLAISFAIGLPLSGCSQEQPVLTPPPTGVVRIVSSLPARGPSAQRSKEMVQAITSAVNEGQPSGGPRVEYIPLDDSDDETGDWSPRRETANATAAASDPSVLAYIGPYNSGAAMLALPITSQAGMLEAGPAATWPGLTRPGWNLGEPERYYPSGRRTFVRLMPPDSVQAQAAARWASTEGHKRLAVLDDGSSYSAGLAREFVGAAAEDGLLIVASVHVNPDKATNLMAELGQADALFYAPSTTNLASAIAQALRGSNVAIYSSDTALSPLFISKVGDAALNWRIVSNSSPPDPKGGYAALTRAGKAFPSQFAANAYDSATLILDAIASGPAHDRAAVLDYVFRASHAGGGSSSRVFDEFGDPAEWTVSGYVKAGDSFHLEWSIERRQLEGRFAADR